MPMISVITAVREPVREYVEEAAKSVFAQTLPPGWSLEWLVQEDGAAPVARDWYAGAEYEANGAHLGTAMTRNFALSRARGELVTSLDYDDLLLPGGLAILVSAFLEHPHIGWAMTQGEDLVGDARVSYPLELPTGLIPAGWVSEFFERTGRYPVHPGGLVARTEFVRAIGGWVALPRAQDVGMMVALFELFPGYQDPTVTWLYRQHPRQTTHHSKKDVWREHQERFVRQRISALRTTGLRYEG